MNLLHAVQLVMSATVFGGHVLGAAEYDTRLHRPKRLVSYIHTYHSTTLLRSESPQRQRCKRAHIEQGQARHTYVILLHTFRQAKSKTKPNRSRQDPADRPFVPFLFSLATLSAPKLTPRSDAASPDHQDIEHLLLEGLDLRLPRRRHVRLDLRSIPASDGHARQRSKQQVSFHRDTFLCDT